MAEIVNLRRARKAKARGEREKIADANRIAHGTPKREREAAKTNKDRTTYLLDAHKLEHDDEG